MDKMSSKKTDSDKDYKKGKTDAAKPKSSDDQDKEADKGKRRSLISALKRSISIKGPSTTSNEPMNIVITLSPAKHNDIIEYMEETVPAGGRAEWVRDSIRLKMRIEKGVYGISTTEKDSTQKGTEEALQTVVGQFTEAMTRVMTDLRTSQTTTRQVSSTQEIERSRTAPQEREPREGPPQLKKIENGDKKKFEEQKPDRPSLDDAISAIVVVE